MTTAIYGSGTYEIVEHEGGFAIRAKLLGTTDLMEDDKGNVRVFKSRSSARKAIFRLRELDKKKGE